MTSYSEGETQDTCPHFGACPVFLARCDKDEILHQTKLLGSRELLKANVDKPNVRACNTKHEKDSEQYYHSKVLVDLLNLTMLCNLPKLMVRS